MHVGLQVLHYHGPVGSGEKHCAAWGADRTPEGKALTVYIRREQGKLDVRAFAATHTSLLSVNAGCHCLLICCSCLEGLFGR